MLENMLYYRKKEVRAVGDMLEYIRWRGDLRFADVPFGPVDALIFSSLVYLRLEGIVPTNMKHPIPLHVAAEAFAALQDCDNRIRIKNDLSLLQAAAEAPRFRDVRLGFYRSKLLEQEQTQFAAMAWALPDGTVFLSFRGTDNTLIGWKEDFNMSFCDSIPAQREAAAYTAEFVSEWPVLLRLGGHSKGGNLAAYAGAKQDAAIQKRILSIFNLDGPGFTESMLADPGYLHMIPKIHTYIPESSVIGILLEHEEAYSVIKSRQVSILQHEPHSWEIMGGDFVHKEEMSLSMRFTDKTIKNWIRDMSREDRELLVETLYELISAGGAKEVMDLLHPKSILASLKTLKNKPESQKLLAGEFMELIRAIRQTIGENKSRIEKEEKQ